MGLLSATLAEVPASNDVLSWLSVISLRPEYTLGLAFAVIMIFVYLLRNRGRRPDEDYVEKITWACVNCFIGVEIIRMALLLEELSALDDTHRVFLILAGGIAIKVG